jgi:hypothetical protein
MDRSIEDMLGKATGLVFRPLSALRRAKSVHPHGLVFEATLMIDGAADASSAPLLSVPAEHPAIIRFSRSAGLPRPLPDVVGAAIRIPGPHGPRRPQDFLLVTSIDRPVMHHLLVPVLDAQQLSYSSLLPYRVGDDLLLVGLEPRVDAPHPLGRDIEERLIRAAATGRLVFDFSVACLGGRFRRIGELRIGRKLPQDMNGLRFNVWNTGGGLRPATFLNGMRRTAYPESQKGWTQTPEDQVDVPALRR